MRYILLLFTTACGMVLSVLTSALGAAGSLGATILHSENPPNVDRVTVLSLPDISVFDDRTAESNPIVVPIFHHRNVGHKPHVRPTGRAICPKLNCMGIAAKKWFCLSLLLGALTIIGCVPVYFYSPTDEPVAGRRIKPEHVAFIKPGITTRDEVISTLGAPTVDLSDLGILVYVWKELKEQWVGVAPGFLFTSPRTADWALLVAMGENNRVVKSGFDQRGGLDTVNSQARKWAETQQVKLPPAKTHFDPLPTPKDKALIYIYWVKPSFWVATSWILPIGVAIDNQYVTEMHDETYAAVSVSAGRHEIVAHPLPPYRYAPMKGNLAVDLSKRRPAAITIEVSPGQQYFLEIVSVYEDLMTTSLKTTLKVRNESDAKPVLSTFRPVW
jgi:hypothetical protein